MSGGCLAAPTDSENHIDFQRHMSDKCEVASVDAVPIIAGPCFEVMPACLFLPSLRPVLLTFLSLMGSSSKQDKE
eukprot:1150812-Pelagomonas_calceolata.AAC.5